MFINYPSFFVFLMLSSFLIGSTIFLNGFFPAAYNKINSDKWVTEDVRPTHIDGYKIDIPTKKYEQVIFMIIDALRSDFPSNDSMPTVMKRSCHQLELQVDIPTVTMPRIKSMMTGSVSSFIDIIFNLGQTKKVDASILRRLNEKKEVIVFAGDDTWTKLFHSEFYRQDANNDSLFVQDFFEGDISVTKSLERELDKKDWTFLILHYLGLDHIGHVEGTTSMKIPVKLKEMDDQVKKILKAQNFKNRLLILTSDHGMRNGGGHGGRSPEETSVPLFIFNHNCPSKSVLYAKKYNQIDIAPTLAIIFSVQIPKNSIGCLISEFLDNYSLEDQLYAYFYNAQHLVQHYLDKFGTANTRQAEFYHWFTDAKESHKTFLKALRNNDGVSAYMFEKAKGDYIRASEKISKELTKSMINFDFYLISVGLSLVLSTTGYIILVVLFQPTKANIGKESLQSKTTFASLFTSVSLNSFMYFFTPFDERNILTNLFCVLPLAASIYNFIKIFALAFKILLPLNSVNSIRLSLSLPLPYLGVFLFHAISLCSSSFIEEEHQTWYYLCPTTLIVTLIFGFWKNIRNSDDHKTDVLTKITEEFSKMQVPVFMLLFLSLLRRLNQTGDKWAHLSDVEDYLNKEDNKTSLTLFFAFGLINLVLGLRGWLKPFQMMGAILATIFIYTFRGISGNVVFFAKQNFNTFSITAVLLLFWISIAIVILEPYKSLLKRKNYGYDQKSNMVEILQSNLSGSLLIGALLHRPHNVVLLPVLIFTLRISYKLCDIAFYHWKSCKDKSYNLVQKTLMTICIANMFYFYQGNSNSLSTIDLNPGYIGQSNYNFLRVSIFVTLNTYGAQINSFLFLVLHMFQNQIKELPQRQEKEQHSNKFVVQTTNKDLNLVISLYAAFTMLPVAFYLCLLVTFRYHLFIYSVFAPKAFYVCYSVLVFYINFCLTKVYFKLFKI